jgi:hypothetical protein
MNHAELIRNLLSLTEDTLAVSTVYSVTKLMVRLSAQCVKTKLKLRYVMQVLLTVSGLCAVFLNGTELLRSMQMVALTMANYTLSKNVIT